MLMKAVGALVIGSALLLAQTGGAAAMNRHVRIHNNTSTTMEKFYASNVGTKDYEEDILGSDVLHDQLPAARDRLVREVGDRAVSDRDVVIASAGLIRDREGPAG